MHQSAGTKRMGLNYGDYVIFFYMSLHHIFVLISQKKKCVYVKDLRTW